MSMKDVRNLPGAPPEIRWAAEKPRRVGSLHLRVRYAETDRMGIAYNAHYLTWFEIGRTEFMRGLGIPYKDVEEQGFQLPLVGAELRLRASVGYDDVIDVEIWIEQAQSRAITFGYRILREAALVAEGTTRHACVRKSDGRSAVLPAWVRDRIG
jgi:acyl-CoA thioester hydrolase